MQYRSCAAAGAEIAPREPHNNTPNAITLEDDGESLITGPVVDQAALRPSRGG